MTAEWSSVMSTDLFEKLLTSINTGWSKYFEATFLPREGSYETVDGEGKFKIIPWMNPNGMVSIHHKDPRNPDKVGRVLVSCGQYPEFKSDHLSVAIALEYGEVITKLERIDKRLSKFLDERVKWLTDNQSSIIHEEVEYPIDWTSLIVRSEDGKRGEYKICGSFKIPHGVFDNMEEGISDLSKLLLRCFQLTEHPNDYDDYLYLNQKGYINDTWTKV